MFNAINASLSDDQPSFHVILNTSNHPPYSVDLASEDFDEKTILEGVPDNLKSNKEAINKLGHFWYADKEIADFVEKTYAQYPDSLFIITGDHSKDYLGSNHTGPELNRIPLVIYGQGINKEMIPEKVAGSHINIIPTIIELIALRGFKYYSLGKSLTQGNNLGISNGDTWIIATNAGKITNNQLEVFGSNGAANQDDFEIIKQNINAIKAISWWRIEKGKYITNLE